VVEGWVVARSPRELSAQTSEDTIFNVVLGSDVSEFLVDSAESLSARHQMKHLKHGHLLNISDVSHGLKLLKVTSIVREVEHEVIGVCNFKLLDALRLVANLADSRFDVVLSLHECLVLGLDLANDSSAVDVALPFGPVDGGKLALVVRGLVEELDDGLYLAELVATFMCVCGHSQSVQPLVCQVIV